MSTRAATLMALVAALLFSTGGVAIKGSELAPLQISAGRSAVAALLLYVCLPSARRGPDPGNGLPFWLTALAYAGTVTLFVTANRFTTAANTIFLQSTATLWVMVFSRALLGEPVRRRDVLGGAVICVGLVLCFLEAREPDALAPDPLLGNALGLGAGLCFGLTLIGMRHASRRSGGSSNGAVLRGNLIAAGLGTLLLTLQESAESGAVWQLGTGRDWLGLLWLGCCQVGLAYILLGRAMRWLPASRAVLLLMLEPVCNPIWTWWLIGEVPGSLAIAGGALILGSVTWLGVRGNP